MRRSHVILLTALVWMTATSGVTESLADEADPKPALETPGSAPLPAPKTITGKVAQTMDVSQYTYVEIDTGDALVWVAGPVTMVKVGDDVAVSGGTPMINFHSTTLDRTFDNILLVSAIQVKSQQRGSSESATTGGDAGAEPEVSGIERIEGGHTVGEVIADQTNLAGSEVAVRGVVVKLNASILGRNWVHLSDGTLGPDGEREIIATTEDITAVGSTVVVRGTVATDRDFGSGYSYSVLIEDAKIATD